MFTSSFFIAIIDAMHGEFSKLKTKKLIAEEYVDNIDFIVSLEFRNTFRDETIFLVRNDIIGVIRIGENYFKNNNIDKIIKDIKYAIKDIKSKKYKRKLLY